ncbi:hypothetical protein [Faecalicoccus pleomorphus]|nr:hypothetical protein [Faecalicoccus pleomorphus]
MGTEASVIGDASLGDNITISAGAVVIKSFNHNFVIRGGMLYLKQKKR